MRPPPIVAYLRNAGVFERDRGIGEPYLIDAKYEKTRLIQPRGIPKPPTKGLKRSTQRPLSHLPSVAAIAHSYGPDATPKPAVSEGILEALIRLLGKDEDAVLGFVHQYGQLELARNGLPAGWLDAEPIPAPVQLVSWYGQYAWLAAALLRCAVQIREGLSHGGCYLYSQDVRIIDAHWEHCIGEMKRTGEDWNPHRFPLVRFDRWKNVAASKSNLSRIDVKTDEEKLLLRYLVAGPVNWWLHTSRARPYLAWQSQGWRVCWSVGGAWAAVGRALADAIAAVEPGAICAHCASPLSKGKRPYRARSGAQRYCQQPECRRVKWRREKSKRA